MTKKKVTKKVREPSIEEELASIEVKKVTDLIEEITQKGEKAFFKKKLLPAAALSMLGATLGLYLDKKSRNSKAAPNHGGGYEITVALGAAGAYIGYVAGDAATKKAADTVEGFIPKPPPKKKKKKKKVTKKKTKPIKG